MKPPRLLATIVCALLAAFAHAAKVGELPAATTSSGPRIAVYLDCSNSMAPYLPAVEAEVRKQFPDADVFSVPAIKVWVDGSTVRGGALTALPHRPALAGPRVSVDASRMTPVGRELLARYAGNFETGSVGAWVDIAAQTASSASQPATASSKACPAMFTVLTVLSGLHGNSKRNALPST